MTDRVMIKKAEEFLKAKFDGALYLNAHPKEKAYRLEHSYRVANIGRKIAEKEGFDKDEMTVACLLHDIAYCEEFGEDGWREHGRRSAHIVRPFLEKLGLPEDRIGDICCGIAIHVDDEADFPCEKTPFALTVGDADNIDRCDVYRIHEILCHDRFLELPFEEKRAYAENRLTKLRRLRDMPMGTKTAKELFNDRLDFYISFYEKLADQLKSSENVL